MTNENQKVSQSFFFEVQKAKAMLKDGIVSRAEEVLSEAIQDYEKNFQPEYAQQQPAAPLSSLPDWKEKIQQAGGVYANTKNEFKFFNKGAEWLLPELLALQAENTRLREQLQQAAKTASAL